MSAGGVVDDGLVVDGTYVDGGITADGGIHVTCVDRITVDYITVGGILLRVQYNRPC